METAASRFVKQNPQLKSDRLIAAERAYAAREDASDRAQKEWELVESKYNPYDVAAVHAYDNRFRSAAYLPVQKALDNAAAASKTVEDIRTADFAAVVADVNKEIRYTLDAIRTSDKNLSGALTCAATLKGGGGKYGDWTLPVTYKVEETSDSRLYVAVSGLKK
jgi:hypothetical protein